MVELTLAASPSRLATPAALDEVFHALSDSTRRAILREVTRGERSVGELAEPHAMSLAAVSKHLDVLERASLIRRRRSGQHRFVRLNPKPLMAAQDWLAYYEKFWTASLDRLQEMLESPAPPMTKSTARSNHRRTAKEK